MFSIFDSSEKYRVTLKRIMEGDPCIILGHARTKDGDYSKVGHENLYMSNKESRSTFRYPYVISNYKNEQDLIEKYKSRYPLIFAFGVIFFTAGVGILVNLLL
jgi:hypothetical protein